ncbi:MAG: Hsp20/alpha crystallin family protein [Sedimentisphaerales bacterium]|nr:Hsp20/alpha crystallin family protein [Sedimentisphaerales bacterium]
MLPILRRKFERNYDPIVLRNPWHDLSRLFDDFLPEPWSGVKNFGNLDLYEDENNFHVEVELPGCRRDNIEVSLEDNTLYLQAKRQENKEEKDKNYYVRERVQGQWSRSIQLPAPVAENDIQASFKDGILKVTLAKQVDAKPHKITIK